MGHNREVGHNGAQIYICKSGSHWGTNIHSQKWGTLRKWVTLGHKYTFAKVGHIGEMGHIGAQIYIRKSRHTAKVGTNRHNLEKVGTWEK